MKKLFAILLLLTLLTGCGIQQQANNPGKGQPAQAENLMDAAALRAIAYEHAGVEEADVYDVDEEWNTLPDKTLYELDFEAKGVEYEYGLNAQTGAVVYSTHEGNPQEHTDEPLSREDAKRIALDHAQLTEDAVSGLQAEADNFIYEVEFCADGFEYDYEIDMYTGEILKFQKERD